MLVGQFGLAEALDLFLKLSVAELRRQRISHNSIGFEAVVFNY